MSLTIREKKEYYFDLTSKYITLHLYIISIIALYYFGGNFSNDAREYEIHWISVQNVDFISHFSKIRFEVGFALIYWFLGQYLSAALSFYFVGLLTATSKFLIIIKNYQYPIWAWLFYFSVFMHLHDANQIRTAISSIFILIALSTETDVKKIMLWGVLAVLFHYSGALVFFLIALKVAPLSIILIPFLGLIWNFVLSKATFFASAYIYLSNGVGAVSFFNSLFLTQIGISVCALLEWKKLSEIQKKGAFFSILGVLFYISFYNNPLLAHRLRELSMIGLIPLLFIKKLKISPLPALIMYLGAMYIVSYNLIFIIKKLIIIYL